MSAKQREILSGHLLATCQDGQIGKGTNQLPSWRPMPCPKANPSGFLNPNIQWGHIHTVHVTLQRAKDSFQEGEEIEIKHTMKTERIQNAHL